MTKSVQVMGLSNFMNCHTNGTGMVQRVCVRGGGGGGDHQIIEFHLESKKLLHGIHNDEF